MTEGPSQRRTRARGALVWDALLPLLVGEPLRVLDMGGGAGSLAVRCAEAGHPVMLIDPSPDAVAAAQRRAEESGVASLLTAAVGDLDSLGEIVEGPFDLIVCHDVLGVVADPRTALARMVTALRPGGSLSLVVGQLPAAVHQLVANGRISQALELLRRDRTEAPRRFEYAQILALVEEAGLSIDRVQGVRVFADSVPSAVIDSDAEAYASLLELERAVASRPEFAAWAAQLHVLARK